MFLMVKNVFIFIILYGRHLLRVSISIVVLFPIDKRRELNKYHN